MPNAVVLASRHAPVTIGNHVLIGPRAYLSWCTIEDDIFLATGSCVLNKAVIGARAEVRINGVVHIRTRIPAEATVPIGWVAVDNPAEILSPDQHERIWAIQRTLGFAKTVWGLDPAPPGETIMPQAMQRYAKALQWHREDAAADGKQSGGAQ